MSGDPRGTAVAVSLLVAVAASQLRSCRTWARTVMVLFSVCAGLFRAPGGGRGETGSPCPPLSGYTHCLYIVPRWMEGERQTQTSFALKEFILNGNLGLEFLSRRHRSPLSSEASCDYWRCL